VSVDLRRELAAAEQAAHVGATVVALHYARTTIAVETKPDDSPVTDADRDANGAIIAAIQASFPDDVILTEELPDDGARLGARRVWIIDPLDGTRDFVARTGQFSVHVALVIDGEPVVGVMAQPATSTMYAARLGGGAWRIRDGTRAPIRVSSTADVAALRIGVSRLNASDRLGRFLDASGLRARAVAIGASVKHAAVAAGELEAAINLSAGEQEWDTCAPDIVIREAGGLFTDGDGNPFRYNQRDLTHVRGSIASNRACHAALVALVQPHL
jgi:3'(2'), 5'-bisphosphate nucleotidase